MPRDTLSTTGDAQECEGLTLFEEHDARARAGDHVEA